MKSYTGYDIKFCGEGVLGHRFIDVADLKKEIEQKLETMIMIQDSSENETARNVYEGYIRGYKEVLNLLCNSSEQNKSEESTVQPDSQGSVSGEHNKCTCPEDGRPRNYPSFKNPKLCGRCGGKL